MFLLLPWENITRRGLLVSREAVLTRHSMPLDSLQDCVPQLSVVKTEEGTYRGGSNQMQM